jgi:hypothetical protein
MRRLIRPWTLFPATSQTSTFRNTFRTVYVGNSPVATRCCEHMSRYLPGLRHALPTQHLRPKSRLTRDKLGRLQDLGYLDGGVSTSIPLPSAYVQSIYMSY